MSEKPESEEIVLLGEGQSSRNDEQIWKDRISKAKRIATNPSVSYATILTLIGVVIALWLYDPSPRASLIFRTVTFKQLVFDDEAAGPGFRVIDNQGETIPGNVYLSRITFWNEGTTAIDSAEFRAQPGIFVSRPGSKVEIRVVDQQNRAVDQFRVWTDSVRLSGDGHFAIAARLSWERFDPGSFVTIQALYSGGDTTEVLIAGDTRIGEFRAAKRAPIFEMADVSSTTGRFLFLALLACPLLIVAILAAGFLKIGASALLGLAYPSILTFSKRGQAHGIASIVLLLVLTILWIGITIWIMSRMFPMYEWLFAEPPVPSSQIAPQHRAV